MARTAHCSECDGSVSATSATPVVTRFGIRLLCADCDSAPRADTAAGAEHVSESKNARAVSNRESTSTDTIDKTVPLGHLTNQDDSEDLDMSLTYPNVEDESVDGLGESHMLGSDDGDDDKPAAVESDGRDYASASGAIEAQGSGRGPRPDTTPPPAVVVNGD